MALPTIQAVKRHSNTGQTPCLEKAFAMLNYIFNTRNLVFGVVQWNHSLELTISVHVHIVNKFGFRCCPVEPLARTDHLSTRPYCEQC